MFHFLVPIVVVRVRIACCGAVKTYKPEGYFVADIRKPIKRCAIYLFLAKKRLFLRGPGSSIRRSGLRSGAEKFRSKTFSTTGEGIRMNLWLVKVAVDG